MKNYEQPIILITTFDKTVETTATESNSAEIEFPWEIQ